MAKTILEDISGFLAEQLSKYEKYTKELDTLKQTDIDTLDFIMNQISIISNDLLVKIETNADGLQSYSKQTGDQLILINNTLNNIKEYLAKSVATQIVEDKKIITSLQKTIDWTTKELYGAAEDRTDIRTELGYEINKRREQDNVLNTKIESEIVDRLDKQTAIKQDLETQIASTNEAITSTNNSLNKEVSDRITQGTTLTNSISTESLTRANADTALDNKITTLNNSLTTETSLRLAQDTVLQTTIGQVETNLKEIIAEIETRRIADLNILSARDNLLETKSKERDYKVLDELRDIYSDTPLVTYNLTNNKTWDNQVNGSADVTSTATSAGAAKHGILGNLIRKVNTLAQKVQGYSTNQYDNDTLNSTNNQVGLDYWVKSLFKTSANEFSVRETETSTNYKKVIESNYSADTLQIGYSFNIINLLSGFITFNKSTANIKTDATTITATSVTTADFGGGSTIKALIFDGTATKSYYADIAERYAADDIYEPGLILGVGGKEEVTLWQPGMALAGIVSTNPGYMLNSQKIDPGSEQDKRNPYIALKGRVPLYFEGKVLKGQYMIAHKNGYAKAYPGTGYLPYQVAPDCVGVALHDADSSLQKFVEVKV